MRSGVFEQVHECLRIRAHGKVDLGTHARGRHGFDGVKRRGLALASSIFFRLSLCPSKIADKQSFSFFQNRHVVLPPDIAKCLPKNRLLKEVRRSDCERYSRLCFHCLSVINICREIPCSLSFPLCLLFEISRTQRIEKRRLITLSFFLRRVQAEWRGLGVQQSRGWVHYAIHRPEPHIMLYRRPLNYGQAPLQDANK